MFCEPGQGVWITGLMRSDYGFKQGNDTMQCRF